MMETQANITVTDYAYSILQRNLNKQNNRFQQKFHLDEIYITLTVFSLH